MAGPFDFLNDLAPIASLGAGIWSYFDDKDYGEDLVSASTSSVIDPFGASNRERYQSLLNRTYGDPSRISDLPGYTFARDQGEMAINRGAAKRGGFYSGNVLHELARYNQGLAGQYYDDEMERLIRLSGAGFTPQAPSSASLLQSGTGLQRNAPGHITSALGLTGGSTADTVKGVANLASSANSIYKYGGKAVDFLSGLGGGATTAAAAPSALGGSTAGSLSGLVGPSAGYATNAASLAGGAAAALSGVGGHAAGSLGGLIGPSAGYASNAASLATGAAGQAAGTGLAGLAAPLASAAFVAPILYGFANQVFGTSDSQRRSKASDKLFEQYAKSSGIDIPDLRNSTDHTGVIDGYNVRYGRHESRGGPWQFYLTDKPGYVYEVTDKGGYAISKYNRSGAWDFAAQEKLAEERRQESISSAQASQERARSGASNQDEQSPLPTTRAGWDNYFGIENFN